MKAKTKFTRLWSILLALVMVVGMLPTVALAAEPATEKADFSTDPTAALNLLNAAKTGTEDSTWDPDTNTLTLNGVNFTTTADTAVYLPDGSTIVLNGDNTIKGGNSDSLTCYGIYAEGSLTISGSGKLNATGGTATDEDGDDSYGIYTVGSLTISEDADVTANGGTATDASCGIEAEGDVTIIGGTVKVTGGASNDYNSYGIYGENVIISGGTVNATGGEAKDDSYGIYTKGNITITDGTVTANGGKATNYSSYGIYANTGLTISGAADVTATGGEATNGNSYGIRSGSKTEISGGTVNATGGASSGNSFGIYAYNGLTISGAANVTAKGGTAKPNSYGIYSIKDVSITDSTVYAEGGKSTVGSYGIYKADRSLGNLTISGTSVVTATGGEVTGGVSTYSYGICSNNEVTISNTATVTAKGGETTKDNYTCSYGIHASNGLSISGGTVTAEAGTAETDRALSKAPSISISPYWWRISKSGTYNQYPDSASAYTWKTAHTYVEIRYNDPAATTTYTVTFDANGGTGTMAGVSGVLGDYTLPANGFTAPDGKQFKCWSVDGKEKAVGDKIAVAADTTVKAVWENIPAAPIEYEILDGANSSWTQNSDGSLSVRGSGAFSDFVGVKVDGKSVDEKYYTVKEGSTIVTLKADYLNTLTVGSHTLEMIWTDGSASTAFTVSAQTVVESPQTGDNSMMGLWIAVLFVSGFGVVATAVYGKKRKSVK